MIRRVALLAALVGLTATLLLAVGPGRAAAQGPTVSVASSTVAAGATVDVAVSGWVPGVLVAIEVCGNSGSDGATDCADDEAVAVRIDAGGNGRVTLRVTAPPAPCPCVVRATSTVSLDGGVTTPIDVTGAAQRTSTGPADVVRQLDVSGVSLSGGGWRERIALAHERVLRFTMVNVGNVPIVDPPWSVAMAVGGGDPAIVPVDGLGRIEPGARRVVEVAVPVDAFAWGDVVVEGQLPGFARAVTFEARSGGRPWGAVAAAVAVAAIGIGVAVRSRRSRRSRQSDVVPRDVRAPVVIDLRDGDAVTIDLRQLAHVWGAYGPPQPADVEAALRRTLVADLAPLYGLNPDDPADEPYLRAMVERTATRTLAYLRDPSAGLDGSPRDDQGDSSTTKAVATNPS